MWDVQTGGVEIVSSRAGGLYQAVWSPQPTSGIVAVASSNANVIIFDANERRAKLQLEGPTQHVYSFPFTHDGSILASSGNDIRFWDSDTWKPIAAIAGARVGGHLSFNPRPPILAMAGGSSILPSRGDGSVVVWELDFDALRGQAKGQGEVAVRHTTAKIVLVGDSGVGKTGLGWRLAHGAFKVQGAFINARSTVLGGRQP